ncbi:hypothetical protein PHAVU_003G036600 [Phaseolus vulgaris]|uniref:AMP-dependent synthetase/ligase domain-containing protein n=1 Tax=Phaseolus vulgaris TaxID=3885 RepID=V7C5I3_PHAVU|nr:hypothetical protein PHAVU_003G036600g [Phaseolus vulgaris]ESW25447.1 hypothetical protein PHAVU_003G036600g [Phaseolus vulgaris]
MLKTHWIDTTAPHGRTHFQGSSINLLILCDNLKARKYILDELNSTGQKHQLRGFELLKAIHLEPNPFDMERDLVTPTFKLKTPQLLKYYKDHIDLLYKEAKGAMQ